MDDFDTPYMWLGPDAERIADSIREQNQREMERLLMVPEGFDLSDPVSDE